MSCGVAETSEEDDDCDDETISPNEKWLVIIFYDLLTDYLQFNLRNSDFLTKIQHFWLYQLQLFDYDKIQTIAVIKNVFLKVILEKVPVDYSPQFRQIPNSNFLTKIQHLYSSLISHWMWQNPAISYHKCIFFIFKIRVLRKFIKRVTESSFWLCVLINDCRYLFINRNYLVVVYGIS